MFVAYPIEYYWSVHQSEWATDVLFRDAASLSALYPKLVHHGLINSDPEFYRRAQEVCDWFRRPGVGRIGLVRAGSS